jgi:hypothetical protein
VTPLNFVCKSRAPLAPPQRVAMTGDTTYRKFFCIDDRTRKKRRRAKVPMKCWFLATPILRCGDDSARAQCPSRAVFARSTALLGADSQCEKNFAQNGLAGTLTTSRRRKTRESVRTDSLRRAHSDTVASAARHPHERGATNFWLAGNARRSCRARTARRRRTDALRVRSAS